MADPTSWKKQSDWGVVPDTDLPVDSTEHPHAFAFIAWDNDAQTYYNVNITYASLLSRIIAIMGGFTLAYDPTWTEEQAQAYSQQSGNENKICFYKES